MFEQVILSRPPSRHIILQTHRGNDIDNEIAADPVPQHAIEKFYRLVAQHDRWRIRKPPAGIYNCVGHVWASRRTAVYDKFDEAVLRIRHDDGYRVLDWERELPAVGDIACYWGSVHPYRDCDHVGKVVGIEMREDAGLPPKIWVLSKFDDTTGEVVHEASDHPFIGVLVEYWTDRPVDPQRLILA